MTFVIDPWFANAPAKDETIGPDPMDDDNEGLDWDIDPDEYLGVHNFVFEGETSLMLFEVFMPDDESELEVGYYWRACADPSGIPEGAEHGPFDTSKEAYYDAQGW